MPEKNHYNTLIVSKAVYKKALRYALSHNEVGFLFFGRKNKIDLVFRIKNTNTRKTNRYIWDRDFYNELINLHSNGSCSFLAEGHSHSKASHLKRPSKEDVSYFKKVLHIIVFPTDRKLRCWYLKSTLAKSLLSEVQIKVV